MFTFQKENVLNTIPTNQTGASAAFSEQGHAKGGAGAVSRDSASARWSSGFQDRLQELPAPPLISHEYGAPDMLMALKEQRWVLRALRKEGMTWETWVSPQSEMKCSDLMR